MNWTLPIGVSLREERHFGDRVVRCFAERPASVFESFTRACAARAGAEALVCGDVRLTFAQLAERAARIAAGLAAKGVRPGDRVAMRLGNRVEFATVLLGILHLGAIAVPIGMRLARPEVEYIVADCGVKLLVDEETRLDDGRDVPVQPVAEEDTAIILYTSGTTGRPKGAMLTHFNIVHSLLHFQHCMQLGPADRTMLAVPASHVTGVVALMLTAWHVARRGRRDAGIQGARLPRARLARAHHLHDHRAGDVQAVPARPRTSTRYDLSAWRVGCYGGAPMPEATIAELARECPGLGLMNGYGATETTSPATIMPRGADRASMPDSVGALRPLRA